MCALTSAGAVKCWGDNQYGQLGNGSTNSSPTPVDVVGLQSGVRTIAAGGLSMCALLYSNEVKCWGRNTEAALGLGYTSGPVSTPTTVPGLSGTITAVSSGFYYGCALNSIGELRCWGTLPGMVAQPNATLVNNFDGVQTRIITPGAVVILRDYAPTLYQTSPGVDSPVNLGVRVTTSEAGTVTKVLFAKHISNVDAHTAVIWDSTGAVLTTQAFVDETAEGWQEVTLATPVHVDAGATFTVGYSLMHTGFAYGPTFPATTVGPLTIDTGYYVYSSNPTDFPGGTVGSNYGVDFEFMVDAPSATTTVAETTTTVADTTTTVAATTTTVTPTTTTLAASTTTVAPTTTTTAAPTTTSAPTTTTATVTATTALASTTSVVVEPATVTTTPSAVPETTTTAPLVPETTTSVDTLPPTTVAAESLPAVPATAEEQLVLVAGLESTEVTPTEVVAAIETLIDAGISSSAATDLASSDKVLAAIEPEQAAAVFEAIPIAELSGEQLEQLASAVTSAPTAIKNTFESTIDVYGEGIDTYVPVGSVIDVGERKTLVAAMAAVSSIAAAAATAGANAGAGGGSSAPSAGSRERSS